MKITKIEPHLAYPICDHMLNCGYYSDSLFDKCFIEVTVNIDDNWMAPLYRKLWEDVYIKINGSVTRFSDTHELIVGITVSEAISFIYKATPPRFQKSIAESHKSIEDIIKSLETFLTGDNSYIAFADMFFEHAHLKKFDTQWQNFDKIRAGADLIAAVLPKEQVYGSYVYASTHSIEELSKGKDNVQMGASTTLICTKLDMSFVPGIIDFCKKIALNKSFDDDLSFNVKVDNIRLEGAEAYVGCLLTVNPREGGGVWTYLPAPYSTLIKNSYENVK